MDWETLTSDQLAEAVTHTSGVCLLPLSVVERHGQHLPLGTDTYIGRAICQRAAALEPVVVCPDFIFTQILEARHLPGTIAIEPELMLRLLENLCREIARNGFHKIILYSAHGGNGALAPFFAQSQLGSPRDYVVYVATPRLTPTEEAALQALWSTPLGDHAGETETSAMLAIRPDLVHMERIIAGEGAPRDRLKALAEQGAYTAIWWYADYPTHYAGDALPATADKGERYLTAMAAALARLVRAVKADDAARQLQDAFFAASRQPHPPPTD
jgi:creatinine amidohydrolase